VMLYWGFDLGIQRVEGSGNPHPATDFKRFALSAGEGARAPSST